MLSLDRLSLVCDYENDSERLTLVWLLCRKAFDEAVKQLSGVNDPNVAQMLGVIRQREPLAIVMDYLPHGDLRQFLQERVFDDLADRMHRNGPPSLR